MAPVRPVLHRLSCSNETVRNTPKHEFWVQWSGSGTFVAKNSDVTDRVGVPDLSVSGDKFDLVEDDPHDPTTTSEPEAPMQSLNQLPVVTDLVGARSA
jgi:hypothetical protein